jgi:hypothetical protein
LQHKRAVAKLATEEERVEAAPTKVCPTRARDRSGSPQRSEDYSGEPGPKGAPKKMNLL